MRYTPYLDSIGVKLNADCPDWAVNIIDSALGIINERMDWGEYQGKKRKACPENPILLSGKPIGQYHCPFCGMMVLAGIPHMTPNAPRTQDPNYFVGHYEEEYGRPWPPGYIDEKSEIKDR